jgi:hypothetical protein
MPSDAEYIQDILERGETEIRRGGDHELADEIRKLREEIVEHYKQHNRDSIQQKAEHADTNDELSLKDQLRLEGPPDELYQRQDGVVPYCPNCWQVDSYVVKLITSPPSASSMGTYLCPRCEKTYKE